jgi:hypothetical protein
LARIFLDDEVTLMFDPIALELLVNIRLMSRCLREKDPPSPHVAEALPTPREGYERILSIALGRGI